MGLRDVLGLDPIRAARNALSLDSERQRRSNARRRRNVYEDNSENAIKNEITRLFKDPTVRQRTYDFARLARSQALFKRIVNEIARPVYVVPPVRTITPEGQQKRWNSLQGLLYPRLDDVMSDALRYALACNTSFIYSRYIPRLQHIACDVLTPDVVTVIPDPDCSRLELALLYDKVVIRDGQSVVWAVYWDDEITFQLDENLNVMPFERNGPPIKQHGLGRIPFVPVHVAPRYLNYWNETYNDFLIEAEMSCAFLTVLALRKLKARGFRQIVLKGDIKAVPKGQGFDEEGAIQIPEGADLTELPSEADAGNYLEMIAAIKLDAAANMGISRARLNQDRAQDENDRGLEEQRGEMIKLMRPVEAEQFKVLKLVSREIDGLGLSEDATMVIDYGELEHRVDPEKELKVWDLKRRAGIRNVLDQIKSENPEIRTDDEAWAELEVNMSVEAEYIRRRRALNIPEDADMLEPGQSPEDNGAMGPMVRDGLMSKDMAAQKARNGAEIVNEANEL